MITIYGNVFAARLGRVAAAGTSGTALNCEPRVALPSLARHAAAPARREAGNGGRTATIHTPPRTYIAAPTGIAEFRCRREGTQYRMTSLAHRRTAPGARITAPAAADPGWSAPLRPLPQQNGSPAGFPSFGATAPSPAMEFSDLFTSYEPAPGGGPLQEHVGNPNPSARVSKNVAGPAQNADSPARNSRWGAASAEHLLPPGMRNPSQREGEPQNYGYHVSEDERNYPSLRWLPWPSSPWPQ